MEYDSMSGSLGQREPPAGNPKRLFDNPKITQITAEDVLNRKAIANRRTSARGKLGRSTLRVVSIASVVIG